jgi:hypothetical protein
MNREYRVVLCSERKRKIVEIFDSEEEAKAFLCSMYRERNFGERKFKGELEISVVPKALPLSARRIDG